MYRFITYVVRHTVAGGKRMEEYIIDEAGQPIQFTSADHALAYLIGNGITDEEISHFCFKLERKPPILQ